jgi:hypothetical protein
VQTGRIDAAMFTAALASARELIDPPT